MCTKMLIPMKYCILYIKRLSTNFASNIKRSFKGINQQLLFPLEISWFSNDFRKFPWNSKAIAVMNTPGRKSVCSKSAIETPEQTGNCWRFIRMALEHIRISQLLPGVQFRHSWERVFKIYGFYNPWSKDLLIIKYQFVVVTRP